MNLLLLGLLTFMVIPAGAGEAEPPKADVIALVSCAVQGTVSDTVTPLSVGGGRYKYAASLSRLPDGRRVTDVMLFGDSRALLLEGVISRTKVGLVNVASFQREGTKWSLEETHAGPQTALHVRAVASELAKQAPKLMEPPARGMGGRMCVGIGMR